MRQSIVFKLVIVSLVSIFLIIAFFNFRYYQSQSDFIAESEAEQLTLFKSRIVKNLRLALWNFDFEQAQDIINAEVQASLINHIAVYDERAEQVASAGQQRSENQLVETITIKYQPTDMKNLGELLVSIDTSRRQDLRQDALQRGLFSSLYTMLIISVVLVLFSRKLITRPLSKLEHAMDAISTEEPDFNQRLSVAGDKDEIARVALAFNQIISKIESLVSNINHKNAELSDNLSNLNEMQDMLVESEKMASLGSLVAGVAHEVNTPIGIGVTAITTLIDDVENLKRNIKDQSLTEKELIDTASNMEDTAKLTLTHLKRVATLISSFKKIAVDQSVDDVREIDLKAYVDEIFTSLKPRFKHQPVQFINAIDEDMLIENNTGLLAQVISHLIINAFVHAFDGQKEGIITVTAERLLDEVTIVVKDNGCGMDQLALAKVFEPFYTTKRNQGNTGLGSNIVYNIVRQKFKGRIHCESRLGEGSKFIFTIPQKIIA